MNILNLLLALLSFLFYSTIFGQNLTQTVRGTLVDFDTKTEISFAKVQILESNPTLGAIANEYGEFRIENVPVGRFTLKITAFGYQELTIPNLLLESGKEKVLNLEMQSDVQVADEIVVKARTDKSESINKMATVSSKTFTVEETNRYAGSINDPARMVASFAGVVGDSDGNNDIVVRGNSSRGILWRLEGIDIPNPNHFANNGTTGGPVNMLNGAMLANSDFFSGAFAPEYGNALSGVFDVKFRQGNNEKREYSFSAGVLGIDGSMEGPFKKGYRGSYLMNYRYSSIALLDALGILDFNGIPKYQDASINFKFPTKKFGNFALVGLGGISGIKETNKDDSSGYVYGIYNFKASMGVIALKHDFLINPKVYVKSFVSTSTASNGGTAVERDSSDVLYDSQKERYTESNFKVQSIFNYQPNKKNTLQIGGTYTHLLYRFKNEVDETNSGQLTSKFKSTGSGDMLQSFVSWKYRISNELAIVSGVNHTHFLVNNNAVVEPRLGVKWQQSTRNDYSMGFGMHSRLESLSVYEMNQIQTDGSYYYPNRNLDFTKSVHFVAGYGRRITENLRLKTEIYYQYLYNIPIENDPNSSFSLSNSSGGTVLTPLVNKGSGRNFGLEMTLERFFANNFYFLVTTSLYEAKYKTLEGIERNSRYNGNFAFNALGGKEFLVGKSKNKTIGLNLKIAVIGGNRYTPIDLDASIAADRTVLFEDKAWESKAPAIFIPNFGFTYRVNKAKVSHSFKIDVQNVANNQSKLSPYYNSRTQKIEWNTQLSMVPNLIYTIKF